MSKKLSSFLNIALFCAVGAFSMGVSSCAEPKEYCKKAYASKKDRLECTDACSDDNNPEFAGKDSKNLVKACQYGQFVFLNHPRKSAAESVLECDRIKEGRVYQRACRMGVAVEELRYAKSGNGAGSSNDRETGNNR